MRKWLFPLLILVLLTSCWRKNIWENRFDKPRKLRKAFKSMEAVELLYGEQIRIWNVQKGEVVADIGGYDGVVAGLISLYSDSATIYIQDVDTSNFSVFPKILNHFEELRERPITNKFVFVAGTYDSTYLPPNTFDKVILNNVIQYVEDKPPFLQEIHGLLKKDGLFFVRTPVARNESEERFIPSERSVINDIVSQKFEFVSEHEVLSGMNTIFVFKKSDRNGRIRN